MKPPSDEPMEIDEPMRIGDRRRSGEASTRRAFLRKLGLGTLALGGAGVIQRHAPAAPPRPRQVARARTGWTCAGRLGG